MCLQGVCAGVVFKFEFSLFCRICSEYEQFCARALKVPEDSREMMDLIAYMEEARVEHVRDLREAVQVCGVSVCVCVCVCVCVNMCVYPHSQARRLA